MHRPPSTPPSSGKKRPRGLVALGSAAVVAVYGAGYLRTRAAAQQFDEADGPRRPMPPPESITGPGGAPTVASGAPPAATMAMPTTPSPARAPMAEPRETGSVAAPTPAPAKTASAAVASTKAEPAAEAPSSSSEAATTPASAPSPSSSAGTAPGATAVAQEPEPHAVQAAAVAPTPVAPAKPVYKDGTYLGWGTSRHGDIQAQVVIEGGRIMSATIAQCLTRYSCSWISPLPPQVVARQSPETDYVSGATQSTNAFYYAVVEALTKAK